MCSKFKYQSTGAEKMDRYAYVRSLLVLNQIQNNEVSRRAKVTPQCVSRVLRGQTQSRRVKMVIATLLKKEYADVWGRAA